MDEITIISYYKNYNGEIPVNKTLQELYNAMNGNMNFTQYIYDFGDYIIYYKNLAYIMNQIILDINLIHIHLYLNIKTFIYLLKILYYLQHIIIIQIQLI